MDGQIDRQTDRWMDREKDRQMDGQIDRFLLDLTLILLQYQIFLV